jgi:hypothetical protein
MTETTKAKIKIFASITFVLMLLLITLDAEAGGNHDHDLNLTIEYPDYAPAPGPTTQVFTGMDNEEFEKGMAMSAAGDTCVFDYAEGWQGCVGGGWYGSQSALNGSLVTRIDNWAVRVNLQTDTDFDEQAVGVGGSWHF